MKLHQMTKGYIYIIKNASIPEYVKVGMTSREPIDRAKEMDTTGAPLPYEVHCKWKVEDILSYEKAAHKALSKYRARDNREWFKLSPEEAQQKICKEFGKPTPKPNFLLAGLIILSIIGITILTI